MTLSVTYQHTIDDTIAVATHANRKDGPVDQAQKPTFDAVGSVAICAALLMCAVPILHLRLTGIGSPLMAYLIGVEPLAVVAGAVVVLRIRTKVLKARKKQESANNRVKFGLTPIDVKVDVLDPGIKFTSSRSINLLLWGGFWSIDNGEKYIFFMQTALYGFAVPKRAFEDPAAATAFFNECQQRWRAAAATLRGHGTTATTASLA
jgi:hypothetical protein